MFKLSNFVKHGLNNQNHAWAMKIRWKNEKINLTSYERIFILDHEETTLIQFWDVFHEIWLKISFYNPWWKMLSHGVQIGRAHVWTPVTSASRMPSSAWKKKFNQISWNTSRNWTGLVCSWYRMKILSYEVNFIFSVFGRIFIARAWSWLFNHFVMFMSLSNCSSQNQIKIRNQVQN